MLPLTSTVFTGMFCAMGEIVSKKPKVYPAFHLFKLVADHFLLCSQTERKGTFWFSESFSIFFHVMMTLYLIQLLRFGNIVTLLKQNVMCLGVSSYQLS